MMIVIHELDGSQQSVEIDVTMTDSHSDEFWGLCNTALESNMAGSEPEVVFLDIRPGVRQECWFSCGTSSGAPFIRVDLEKCSAEDQTYFRGLKEVVKHSSGNRVVKTGSLEEFIAVLGYAGDTRPIATGIACGAGLLIVAIIAMMVASVFVS
ncbi:MAG: hypothetical protein Q7S34_00555 [bacterium]|nr:hypothetical protein [bacterium]